MLHTAVALSIVFGFIASEFLGLFAGGLISGGYLAFYLTQPLRIVSTLVISLVTYLCIKILSHFMILFGRRRFALCVLLGLLLSSLYSANYYFLTNIPYDMRAIGYIIPGLIANDMEKQGIIKTLLMVILITLLTWVCLHMVG